MQASTQHTSLLLRPVLTAAQPSCPTHAPAAQVLNQAFGLHDIGFELVSVTRVANNVWYKMSDDSAAEFEAKKALRKVCSVRKCMHEPQAV